MQGKVSTLLESGPRRLYVVFAEDLRKMMLAMLAIKLPMIAIKLNEFHINLSFYNKLYNKLENFHRKR